MADKLYETYEVDIDKASAAMKQMADYVDKHKEEISQVEELAKEPLMGLILTALHTGLVKNASMEIAELRGKIMMAFDIGYFFGKMGAGNSQEVEKKNDVDENSDPGKS